MTVSSSSPISSSDLHHFISRPGDRILVIVDSKVYDLTEFAHSHPGGQELIEKFNGVDVTDIMKDSAEHVHSQAAYDILSEYLAQDLSASIVVSSLSSGLVPPSNSSGMNVEKKPETLFDHSKPLFSQLWNMDISKDEYMRLVHLPHHSKESFRFFHSDAMEMLSRTYWWVVPLIWCPVTLFCLQVAAKEIGMQYALAIGVIGVFVWSGIEYCLHRFLFHIDSGLPDHNIFLVLHFTLHGVHHYFPMDRLRLVFPPAMAVIIISFFYLLFTTLMSYHVGVALLGGGIAGYVGYDMIHYFLHHGMPITEHLAYMKSYHLDHHYKDFSVGYGISTTFWDHVFGTFVEPMDKKK